MNSLTTLRDALSQASGRREQLQLQQGRLHALRIESEQGWRRYEAARIIGLYITDETRKDIKRTFDGIGTAAMQAVFGPQSSFSIEFDQTEANRRRAWLTVDTGGVAGDVQDKSGNSAGAVLSTMLRRAMVLLNPALANVMVLDEPLYGIDDGKVGDMAEIDREMVDAHELQIICITHQGAEEYRQLADVVIDARREDGVTVLDVQDHRKEIEEEMM